MLHTRKFLAETMNPELVREDQFANGLDADFMLIKNDFS